MVMPGGSRIPATVRPRPQMFLSERKMSKKKAARVSANRLGVCI